MIETKPLELIYQGPTQVSQVLSPFSASPPSVLLSGFRSRCHIVIKGAFPSLRVQQGLPQLIRLYVRAGFPNEELQAISNQLLIQHQNSSLLVSKTAPVAFVVGFSSVCSRCFSSFLFLVSSCPFSWLLAFCGLLFPFFSFLAQAPLSFCSVFRLIAHGSCSRASVPSSFG